VDDVADVARRRLPRAIAGYLDGGGESEWTLRRNRAAFDAVELLPAGLRDVSSIDLSTTMLDAASRLPIALAPVGGAGLFHPRGELAVAPAAAAAGVPYGISTLASHAIGDIAAGEHGPLWLQLYLWGDRAVGRDLLSRGAELGYQAVILSIDVTVRSRRERELHAGLTLPRPRLRPAALLDGVRHPAWSYRFVTSAAPGFPNVGIDAAGTDGSTMASMFDGTITWDDLDWIRAAWSGPVAVKGILSATDARAAADRGADAVIVSNHGGRQADHVPATIEALPSIVDAVGNDVEVLLDSGIRRGTDILAALALGARGVLIGRPYLYGLSAAGGPGVRHVLELLAEELRIAMGLCDVTSVRTVPASVARVAA
jgi:L-lactate dehydrogenase (cytochrome)